MHTLSATPSDTPSTGQSLKLAHCDFSDLVPDKSAASPMLLVLKSSTADLD